MKRLLESWLQGVSENTVDVFILVQYGIFQLR